MSHCNSVLLAARGGSLLYGLNTDTSDYDYALFGTEHPESGAPYTFPKACSLLPELSRIDGVYRHVDQMPWMAEYSCIYHLAYLFSDAVVVKPGAESFWQALQAMREDIARANLSRFRELCMVRLNSQQARAKQLPYGGNNKALMHAMFYAELLRRFGSGEPYADCIRQDTQTLLAVRKGEIPEAEAWALLDDKLSALNTQQVVRFYRQPKNDRTLTRLQELVQSVQP